MTRKYIIFILCFSLSIAKAQISINRPSVQAGLGLTQYFNPMYSPTKFGSQQYFLLTFGNKDSVKTKVQMSVFIENVLKDYNHVLYNYSTVPNNEVHTLAAKISLGVGLTYSYLSGKIFELSMTALPTFVHENSIKSKYLTPILAGYLISDTYATNYASIGLIHSISVKIYKKLYLTNLIYAEKSFNQNLQNLNSKKPTSPQPNYSAGDLSMSLGIKLLL